VEQLMKLPEGTLTGTKKQPHFFKLLEGDLMMHYPYGKLFEAEHLATEAERFASRDTAPTGLIPGTKTKRATQSAGIIESQFDEPLKLGGDRRYAWIWVDDIKKRYVEEKAHYELSFALPKGSYATNVLDVLRGGNEI
jgi:tRNA pseudouridine13 synthase